MPSDLKQQITDRFVEAIRAALKPCPLIGPKWLQEFPNGKPADFRFIGVRKLARAAGLSPKKTSLMLMQTVSLEELGVDSKVVHDFLIDINHKDKPTQKKSIPCRAREIRDKKPASKGHK